MKKHLALILLIVLFCITVANISANGGKYVILRTNIILADSLPTDSLPILHLLKEDDIASIQPDFSHQTIVVVLKTGEAYNYEHVDWDYEDQYPSTCAKVKAAIVDNTMLFTKVEHEPEFDGRKKAWDQYIVEFCRKHQAELKNTNPEDITVQFIVHLNGQVSDLRVIQGGKDPNIVNLTKLAIRESQGWIPAIQNGRKVIFLEKLHVILSNVD